MNVIVAECLRVFRVGFVFLQRLRTREVKHVRVGGPACHSPPHKIVLLALVTISWHVPQCNIILDASWSRMVGLPKHSVSELPT